jgi:hypothetical protein
VSFALFIRRCRTCPHAVNPQQIGGTCDGEKLVPTEPTPETARADTSKRRRSSSSYNSRGTGRTTRDFPARASWEGRTTKITGKWGSVRQRGPGQLNLDVESSNIAIVIDKTASLQNLSLASNFWGTNIASLNNAGSGSVGLAPWAAVASTCPIIINNGGRLVVGAGVTATSAHNIDGTMLLHCAGTTLNAEKGAVRTDAGTNWATVNQYDTTMVLNGTAGTLNLLGTEKGAVDTTQNPVARTIGAVNGSGHLYRNHAVLTITADNRVNMSLDHDSPTSPIGPID